MALIARRSAQQVGDDRGRRDDLLEVVEDEQDALVARASRPATRRSAGSRSRRRRARWRSAARRASGSRIGSSGDEEDAVREVVRRPWPRAGARAGSCPSRPGRSASAAGSWPSRPAASSSSASRPTNVVSWVGRLFGRASSDRRAGKSAGSPSALTWTSRTGARRSLSRCSPRSRSVTPSTGWSTSRSRVSAPRPGSGRRGRRAAIRAARLMSSPTRLAAGLFGPPVWRPIRTRIVGVVGPRLGGQRALRRDGGGDGIAARSRNDDEERVALGALLDAAVRLESPRAGSRDGARAARRSGPGRPPARGASSPRCR